MQSLSLLDRVVEQTIFFFPRAWAKYPEVHTESLQLSPPDHIINTLNQDYRAMRPMFFIEPPPMAQILGYLPDLEKRINEMRHAT